MLGVTACGSEAKKDSSDNSKSTKTENSGELKTVRIGTGGSVGEDVLTENIRLAYILGYLDEELKNAGYKAEYFGFAQAGPALNEALAAGEIDVAEYADYPLITAAGNDVGVTAFAMTNSQQNYAILAAKGSDLKKASQLEGKKVIVGAGTILQKYFLDVVEQEKLKLDKIEQINSVSDAQTLLASGQADAVSFNYQGALMFESYGLGTVIESTVDKPELASGVLLAGRDEWLKDNGDAAVAIIKALKRAQEYAVSEPKSVYEKLETEKVKAAVYEKTYSYDESFDYFDPAISDEYLKRAQKIADFMYKNQLLKKKVTVKDIFDNSYVEKAEK